MMRSVSAFLASCVALMVAVTAAQAGGPNANAYLPMHAVVATGTPAPACGIPDPCDPGPPLVNVPLGSNIGVYLLIRNYDNVAGVQTAFDWGDWTFLMSTWSCQVFQLSAVVPHGNGGPTDGTIATVFDCITGGQTEVVGFMRFIATTPGCLTQVESSFPDGTIVVNCSAIAEPISPLNRGAICVNAGGINACEPTLVADGPNANVTLPLHAAIETELPPFCDIGDPCDPGPPLVNVPLNSTVATYLMVRGYSNVAAVQTAFDWGDWEFISGGWGCQPGEVAILGPYGHGGSNEGTLFASFDCILGGQTAVLGSMLFLADAPGCVTQVESSYSGGTFLQSCGFVDDPVPPERRGSICVDQGGVNACGTIEPQAPICDAGGPYFGAVGEAIQFDGSDSFDPDGTIVAYDWDFGDGATGTGVMPTHAYAMAGLFTVTLTVTDDEQMQSSCATTAETFGATAIAFVGFEAVSVAGEVHLSWRTAIEFARASFNVHRRDPGAPDYVKLNADRIASEGTGGTIGRYIDGAVVPGQTYEYRIELIDPLRDARETSEPVRVTVTRDVDARPVLHQNHPNPFNPFTTITFTVPEVSSVKLAIFDTRGRLVRTLVDRVLDAGIHLADWDGRDQSGQTVSSGVYIYRLDVGSVNLSKPMVLVR